ncbi:MAG TPA: DUF4340 domain-containing protein [Steroidobacteraceae bacterium]
MTPRRVLLLLVVGLLVIAFAVWVASRRHLERNTLTGDLVLPGMQAALNSVSEVRLSKGDGTRTELAKGASGWTVVQRQYPADSGKVRKLLLELAALKVVEEKTRTPENYPLLGVEDVTSPKATGTEVEAITPGKTFAIIIGKSSSAKSGFVRVNKALQSLLASPLITLDADPRQWLDRTLLDIPQERIQEVSVHPAQGPAYSASRATKEQSDFTVAGIPKGRELSNPMAADPIAGSLGGLMLEDVQKAPATPATTAAPAERSHATFKTFDGLQVELVGHKDGTRSLISVSVASSAKATQAEAAALSARVNGWEFEIPSYKYDGLYRPLEDLLKKPEPAKKAAHASGKAHAGTKQAAAPPH